MIIQLMFKHSVKVEKSRDERKVNNHKNHVKGNTNKALRDVMKSGFFYEIM